MNCSTCGLEKPLDEFNWKNRKRGVRHRQCRSCTRRTVRGHYQNNVSYYKEKAKRQRTNPGVLDKRRMVYEYLVSHPCVDCGETDPVVLEFDHRDPAQKIKSVTMMTRSPEHFSRQQLIDEINKCDVRCANCHRRRTAKQFGWYIKLAPVLALASNE